MNKASKTAQDVNTGYFNPLNMNYLDQLLRGLVEGVVRLACGEGKIAPPPGSRSADVLIRSFAINLSQFITEEKNYELPY